MKLSVFTVATPELSPEQLAAAAKEAGISGIEWRYKEIPPEMAGETPSFWRNNLCSIPPEWDDAELSRFRDAAARYGLRSLSVTPYLGAGDLEGTERVLDAARRLGASFIRLGVHRYDRTRNFRELFELQRAYLREAEALCRQYGVKGLVETHHVTIAPSASAAYRLVEGLQPEHIGVLYDPGNMVYEGFENYRMGMEILGPYLAHVHVKNGGWAPGADENGMTRWVSAARPMNRGMADWRQVVADLRAVGYTGWLGVEDFSGELPGPEMLKKFSAFMNGLMQPSEA
ncbi:sugar phosphate isomerase/epimerase family protein [Paenibacillus chitinolyticus]|uniref:sugar phosphate isomerase/epimerase family protein n=1 Tax=Paenibacillus chitinolyticus TaxID=79263 RepID=UPI001C47C024|nr:sugar phosphate isomerase/epimerase [Paenibacillus chitinolyticus]MBV6716194.1 sugar phosphate isomerase/epimerase [Paenibacillus chitinolyticus]